VETYSAVQGSPGDRAPAPEFRRVLLTGARGFVGSEVSRQLLTAGHEVVAISRHLQARNVPPGVIQVAADITAEGWQRWCEGCGAAIHLVGIIRQAPRAGVTFERAHVVATRRVIAACRSLGIRRLIHMSALGAREGAATPYHRTKWQGEELVRASGLEWTIFRPSTLFGPGDGFSTTIARAVRRFPVFPVFGDGTYRVQPIAVEEVARCFVAALERPVTVGETYELGGPEALTYNEVLRRIAQALGLRRAFVHFPLGFAKLAVSMFQHFPGAPITRDQLTMLLEGSTCDSSAASLTFGVPAARFQGPIWLRSG
jgi:NADH dehydrogenase